MLDGLQEIWFTLRQNKLRTLLTAFGVFWGIFMLILLLGFGRGMQNGVWEDFGSDVLDFMIVWSGDTSVPYHGMGLGRKIALDEADLQAVKEQINGVRMISGTRRMGDASVTYNGKNSNTELIGIPDEYFHIKEDIPFNYGRKTNPFDEDEIRKVVALGDTVVERLFAKGEDPVGKDVRIKDVVFKVTGVFHDKGQRGRASEWAYIPQSTYEKVYGGGGRLDNIWLRPEKGVEPFEL